MDVSRIEILMAKHNIILIANYFLVNFYCITSLSTAKVVM